MVCFVPRTAPGDRVRVAVHTERKRHAVASVEAVLEPGPDRVEPPCPVFGRCGGCDWQHLSPAAQTRARTAITKEQLARIDTPASADAVVDPVAAAEPWHYRHRITLHLTAGGEAGFLAAGSHEVVPIPGCPIADRALEAALGRLPRELVADLHAAGWTRLELRTDAAGKVDATTLGPRGPRPDRPRPDPRDADPAPAAHVAADGELAARLLAAGLRGAAVGDETAGDPILTYAVSGLQLRAGPGAFTQVHPAMNERLVERVVAAVGKGSRHVVDLYAGIGNLSLPLAAAGHRVTAVEQHRGAVADGRANAKAAGLGDRLRFLRLDAARWQARQGEPVDAVVLDPPRAGAAPVLTAAAAAQPDRIVYVSCHPPALARDVGRLRELGYELVEVTPLDMFPQTGHIEAVAVFDRA